MVQHVSVGEAAKVSDPAEEGRLCFRRLLTTGRSAIKPIFLKRVLTFGAEFQYTCEARRGAAGSSEELGKHSIIPNPRRAWV